MKKFAVIVIFKNNMKLDKFYDTRQKALCIKHNIYRAMNEGRVIKFADSAFSTSDILLVTMQEIEENKEEV